MDLLQQVIDAEDERRLNGTSYHILVNQALYEMAERILDLERRLNGQDDSSSS